MSDQVQPGHEHQTQSALVVSLNAALGDQLDERQLGIVSEAIAGAAGSGDEATVRARLSEALERAGVPQPEPVVARLAENLARSGGETTVVDSHGDVHQGDPTWDPATAVPDVVGSEDPEHGDRPTYS